MSNLYVHCGSDHFDKNLFVFAKNQTEYPWVKPDFGGMWASPLDSDNKWDDWCLSNDFHIDELIQRFYFKLTDDAKVIVIDSNDKLEKLVSQGLCRKHFTISEYYLDFEKILQQGYDAISVIINAETYWSLYGWDCDTLLVLNPDCIIEVE